MSANSPEAAVATACHSTMRSVMNADPNAKRLMTTANMRKGFLIPMSFDPFMSSLTELVIERICRAVDLPIIDVNLHF